MLGAGTIINPLLKIVTTVAILAAVGFFIVKPVLETTEEVTREATEQSRQAAANFDQNFSRSRAESYALSLQATWPAAARAVKDCIRDATQGRTSIGRCDDFGQLLAHTLQSDRNFALSYASSLDAQGNGDAAERVRDCVARAQFRAAAMERCRALADDLLFG